MAEHPILEQARTLRRDLDSCRGKLNELIRLLDALELPDPLEARCPHCGLSFVGPATLEEHVHVSHGGPLPMGWARADELAGATAAP